MDENSVAADNLGKCNENAYAEQGSISGLSFGRLSAQCMCDVQHMYKNKVNQKEGFIILLAYWADGKDNQQRKVDAAAGPQCNH
jgi:hypothetical protein